MIFAIPAIISSNWKLIVGALSVGALVAAFLWHGHVKYQQGVRETDARWEEAGRKLEKKVEVATGVADSKAEARVEKQNDIVAKEKQKIDEAVAKGASPFDVLFGGTP